jgi:hypothetical protein
MASLRATQNFGNHIKLTGNSLSAEEDHAGRASGSGRRKPVLRFSTVRPGRMLVSAKAVWGQCTSRRYVLVTARSCGVSRHAFPQGLPQEPRPGSPNFGGAGPAEVRHLAGAMPEPPAGVPIRVKNGLIICFPGTGPGRPRGRLGIRAWTGYCNGRTLNRRARIPELNFR